MSVYRNNLYLIIFIACLSGYIWFYINISVNPDESTPPTVCIIKKVTGIPCPSCGSTRSIMLLAKRDFIGAITLNPLSLITATIMLFAPIWIAIDVVTKKQTLFNFYQKVNIYLKKPKYAIPLMLFVIIIWIRNIINGL